MDKITVILPTYNERENITPLVSEIETILTAKRIPREIIIVDDESPDGTGDIAEHISKEKENITVIKNKKRIGLARSILEGIKASTSDVIVVMDSDGSHPPKVVAQLIEGLDEAELCLASRYIKGGEMEAPGYKYQLSKLLNQAIDATLCLGVKDSTGGFFAVKKEALNQVILEDVFTGYGEYFFKLLYEMKSKEVKIKSIPFKYKLRKFGKTKTNVFLMGGKYLLTAIYLRIK